MDNILTKSIEGHWSIAFGVVDDIGLGDLIFERGNIYGADGSYAYNGMYDLKGDMFHATIEVTRLPLNNFVGNGFNNFSDTKLVLTGPVHDSKITNGHFIAVGYVDGYPEKQLALSLKKFRNLR